MTATRQSAADRVGRPEATALRSIITVRHSVTAHNAAHVISGRLDEPLSDEGRLLAREMVASLGLLAADIVISSPMRRAVETATLLTGRAQREIVTSELCLERDYGELQGLSPEAVRGYADRVDYVEVGGIRHSLNPPGGESFPAVRARARRFQAYLGDLGVASVLVVTHQTFLQQLHGLLLRLGVRDSLGLDIRTLQVDRFDLVGGGHADHRPVHPGMGRHRSW
jgi:broad specificity phosphatase PhoE